MRIGETIRYPAKIVKDSHVDGLRNWYSLTAAPDGANWKVIKLDSGINTSAVSGISRIPFLALSSSPHRFGSSETPWEDVHRPDQGYSRYFGDAKPGLKSATEYLGNQRMLQAFIQQGGDKGARVDAPPILIFEAVEAAGRIKGQRLFHGVGVITNAELVVQREDRAQRRTFPNYVFEIAILDLSNENETLDWEWINARRDGNKSAEDALKLAPVSWQRWVDRGSIGSLRRNVITRGVVSEVMQRPSKGSDEEKILREIYSFYEFKRHKFEALADFVVQTIFESQGIEYRPGWITQGSGDGGFDFVASIDIDSEGALRSSRQVLLGQAKCEKLDKPTNGLHIARLAARLRRGWIGAYVTTSWFSLPVQREILVDRYPVVLVDGLRLAQVVRRHVNDNGITVKALLEQLDDSYEERIKYGDPENALA